MEGAMEIQKQSCMKKNTKKDDSSEIILNN